MQSPDIRPIRPLARHHRHRGKPTVRKGGMDGGRSGARPGLDRPDHRLRPMPRRVRRLGEGDVIGGFARRDRRRLHLVRTAGVEARAKSQPADPRCRRARQGLAHGSLLAAPRSDDDRRRQGGVHGAHREPATCSRRRPASSASAPAINYALAAARALADGPLDAEAIVRRSLDIAADICVYTNRNVTIETLKGA